MRIDHTRTTTAKARTVSRRTARKMRIAAAFANLFLCTVFPADNAFASHTLEG